MPPDASRWLEWPYGAIRVGVVLLVVVSTLGVVVRYPSVLQHSDASASESISLSYADREIAGGNGLVADQTALYAARGLIPKDATFNVVVNPEFKGGSDLTVPYVASFYRYFLMPRRMAETAPWVVCYACDLGAYGSAATVVWKGEDGISIVRVKR